MKETQQPNRLIHEASPYLQQHAHNPVDWYPWGEEALERAKREDKPIFLSIGYSACHWCHVMEHESFDNPDIAAIMNEHFVCIKVDREERPDLDQIYQSICQMVTRSGGWPLSVWLTPDQKPFYVGTYFPPTEKYGRPGFPQVLRAISRAYHEKREQVIGVSEQWTGAIATSEAPPEAVGAVPDRDLLRDAAREMSERIDRVNGGFGSAPKFPNTFSLEVMLRYWRQSGDDLYRQQVSHTLRRMAEGGIYDQLGGGFHRYSVDERWAVPHFEKMLYDNAVLPPIYLGAWQATGEPLFRRIAEETLDYVIREMTHPAGGFYATTDADSEGAEGKFFVFGPDDVREAVGDDLTDLMCRHYGVTAHGNFEHTSKTVLHMAQSAEELAKETGHPLEEIQAQLAEGCRAMLAYRERRVPPFRDEKILTAWNGLMASAFAKAGRILQEARYTDAARRAIEFVLQHLTDAEGNLLRRFKDGKAGISGYIEDYAYLTAALLDLYEATFDERYLLLAERYAADTLRLFYDGSGSFFLTQEGGERLIHRSRDTMDAATPSGASVVVMNLLRLAPFTSDETGRQVAESVLRTYAQHMKRFPGGMATLLHALDFYLSSPTEITFAGAPPSEWLRQLGQRYEPNLLLTQTGAPREERPIWVGKAARDGQPTAYVCRNFACSAPNVSWTEVESHLE